jgi:hypothetical protein
VIAIVISSPRDEVFGFVADARNRPRWDDSVRPLHDGQEAAFAHALQRDFIVAADF